MSRVLLSDVHHLTFYEGEHTVESRRGFPPLPQLTCEGKPCHRFKPDVVYCENIGGSGVDIDWECKAELPSDLRLGRVQVSCEGWDYPGDPYILKGSCALTYRILSTNQYESNVGAGRAFAIFAGIVAFLLSIGYCVKRWCPGSLDDSPPPYSEIDQENVNAPLIAPSSPVQQERGRRSRSRERDTHHHHHHYNPPTNRGSHRPNSDNSFRTSTGYGNSSVR